MEKITLSPPWFAGVVSFRGGGGWLQPLRLRADELPLHDDNLVMRAETTAGVRLRFATGARSVVLGLEADGSPEARRFDLTTDDALCATVDLPPGGEEVCFDRLPAGRRTLEIWLPTHHQSRLRWLAVPAGETAVPAPDTRRRWVTYGSSITHCRAAHSPSRTWPAVAARQHGLNLTSLGYGGNCHMEPLVAMMIRDLPADFISLKVGINMLGSVSARLYRPLLVGMVKIIREKHPLTPLAVVSPIVSPPRENTPGPAGMTLRLMRRELETAVERLRAGGDRNVHYVSGLDLFGADLVAAHLPDQLHPDGDGYEIIGRNFAARVLDRLFP